MRGMLLRRGAASRGDAHREAVGVCKSPDARAQISKALWQPGAVCDPTELRVPSSMYEASLDRRSFLSLAGRLAIAAATGHALVLGGCSETSPVGDGEAGPAAPLPRLETSATELDVLNTLIQAERYLVAICAESSSGQRLSGEVSSLVDTVREGHLAHLAWLESAVQGSGATPSPPRLTYSLPTPLGDQRRALATLLDAEVQLLGLLAGAAETVAPVFASKTLEIGFSTSAFAAALRWWLEDCPEPRALSSIEGNKPWGRERSGRPVVSSQRLPAASVVLRALAEVEESAAVRVEAAKDVFWEVASTARKDAASEPGAADGEGRRLSVSVAHGCVFAWEEPPALPGTRSRVELPSLLEIVRGSKVGTDRSVRGGVEEAVLSAASKTLEGIAGAHRERAAAWRLRAGEATPGDESVLGNGLPPELSPVASGLREPSLGQTMPAAGQAEGGDAEGPPDPGTGQGRRTPTPGQAGGSGIEALVEDVIATEVKSARALAVAASNLAAGDLRVEAFRAVISVADVLSRFVRLGRGTEFTPADLS